MVPSPDRHPPKKLRRFEAEKNSNTPITSKLNVVDQASSSSTKANNYLSNLEERTAKRAQLNVVDWKTPKSKKNFEGSKPKKITTNQRKFRQYLSFLELLAFVDSSEAKNPKKDDYCLNFPCHNQKVCLEIQPDHCRLF